MPNKKTIVHILIGLAVLVAFVRFREQIAGLVAKVPLVNKAAGVG